MSEQQKGSTGSLAKRGGRDRSRGGIGRATESVWRARARRISRSGPGAQELEPVLAAVRDAARGAAGVTADVWSPRTSRATSTTACGASAASTRWSTTPASRAR